MTGFYSIEPLESRIAPAFASIFELSGLNGANGFTMNGVFGSGRAGFAVSDAGDVNGDGFDDVIMGAPLDDLNGSDSGATYVVFGKADGFASKLELSTLDGSNGFKISGSTASDSGFSISSAGDVNGDDFDDVIIGALNAGGVSGASYVVFGKSSGFAANLNLATLDGSNGFKLSGIMAGDITGGSVSDAGDVNGDGFADVIIGATGADPNGERSGASYVIFGKPGGFAANLNLSTLDGSNGFRISGLATYDLSGSSVSAAGDVNGDGFDAGDAVVGGVIDLDFAVACINGQPLLIAEECIARFVLSAG